MDVLPYAGLLDLLPEYFGWSMVVVYLNLFNQSKLSCCYLRPQNQNPAYQDLQMK